jgi:chitobiase/beta-hexosaminidase-like protein/VCBS repeat protein
VLPGNGNGTFQTAQNFGVGMAPMSAAVGDFNRDGQPDLASADYFSGSVSILINRTVIPKVATPAFSPSGGTYTGSVTATVSDQTSGATIHYTTDGTTPTTSSPVYTSPISVTQSTTIRAMAAAGGMTDSDVASVSYTIQQPVATPAFSPSEGTYTGSVTVTISDATSGATIHYTTDGTTPTTSSPIHTDPIFIKSATTIKTMAASSGMADSDVASATYTIRVSPPVLIPPGGRHLTLSATQAGGQ